jgi:hypothetical protein
MAYCSANVCCKADMPVHAGLWRIYREFRELYAGIMLSDLRSSYSRRIQ